MLSIRRIEEKDRVAVMEMMRVFYDSPAVFHTSSDSVLEQDITDCIRQDFLFVEGFVFEKEGVEELLGYAMIAPSYTTEYGGLCVWLEDLYVKPAYRREGISTQFFHYLEGLFPEAVRFKLEVERENETAIASYKKNGYGISPYFEMTKEMTEG